MLPQFLVVGAAKSGTSSLDRYLGQHPQIFMPTKKEAHYFSIPDFPPRFRGPGDEGMNNETIRSLKQYESLFSGVKSRQVVGESSAFYLYYPGTAERIYQANPEMKVLILLRNPVTRAYSAYMHLVRDARESLSFEDGLKEEKKRKEMDHEPMWLYFELGLYAKQVRRYLDVFGKEQVKVILYEDFSARTDETMAEVFRFLGVDPEERIDTGIRYNESGVPKSRALFDFVSKPNFLKEMLKPLIPAPVRERLGLRAKTMLLRKESMQPETYLALQRLYEPEIEELSALLQHDFSLWTKHKT